jgi:hypothetical protein
MRRSGPAFLPVLGVLLITGCSKPTVPTLPSNPLLAQPVPADSVTVLFVDWTQVGSDDYFQKLLKKDELEKSLRDIGIDANSISAMVLFTDIAAKTKMSSGAILIGLFDTQAFAASVRSNRWAEEIYAGYVLYADHETNGWVACLKSGSLVVGTKRAVQEVIDVESGRKPSFVSTEPFDRVVKRTSDSQQTLSMVVSIPQAVQDVAGVALDIAADVLDGHHLGPLAEVLKKVCLAKGVSVSMSRRENSFPVEMAVITNNKSSARVLSGSLNVLKSLTKLVPEQELAQMDAAMRQAFESLVIERDGEIVTVKMVMPESVVFPTQTGH